ncbi:molybdate ABC transporter substrate-binding protein [Nocardia vaccinii]|uniref:molybdate ABC transporter substrate-binding protein n=1 Tax=Nocardia vaccinii TaxID=1822 RepID=UPI00082B6DE7|nr:molybdate ABC transporter substrate-binding protein [Nocardia vaccinii]
MSRARRAGAVITAAALGAALAACGSSDSGGSTTTLTVFAAASLNRVFAELGEKFESEHPNTKVSFSFAGSSDLAAQLNQGAPADVFAAADTANMRKVLETKRITATPRNFATNVLTIVTPPGNPKHVARLADLAAPDMKVVVCAPQVPCGSAAEKVEAASHVTLSPVSEESDVTDVLSKVTSGDADAGLVYVTDAAGAGNKVTTVSFPESSGAVNTYPIAAVADSKHADLAEQFDELVTGPDGRAALAKAGFGAP